MKKVMALFLGAVMIFSLVACGEAKASTPYSAADSVGKTVSAVTRDFSNCGFTNVTEKALEDLTLDEAENDGIVESVTIDSASNFSGNQKFAAASSVIVSYHSFAKVAAPIDYELAQTTDASELIALFSEAGFINIYATEVIDLDPDEENLEFKNDVAINGDFSFSSESEYPLDSVIEIITHRTYEKYNLKLTVDFVGNLLFNTYDVKVNVDGHVHRLEHGKDGTFEYRLQQGTYPIVFSSADSSSVKGAAEIELNDDVDAAYKISCHSNEITVETLYVESKSSVGENEARVPCSASSCKYTDYQEIKKEFENAGFSNISTAPLYDIVWGWTDEGEVESVTIDGQSEFIRGDIFSKDIPIVITYHMKAENDPNKKTESSEQVVAEETYNLDKDLIVAQCTQDKDKTTMYRVTFAECDSNGNYTNFYTFSTVINPRAMGEEFNAIGPLPSWFYVGATVHVKGTLSGNTISQSGCSVTEVKEESESVSTESVPMPIIAGTSLDSIVTVGTKYGLSARFSDEDWGHGTKMHGMSSSGLSLEIVYSTDTKEALLVSVVTYTNLSTKQEQEDFINAVAKVSCPSANSEEVLKWVASNIGTEASTTINGTTYSLTIGPSGNLCYNAGNAEWETWYLSFDQ